MSVWAIAHRGASRDCPENTLAAFDEALRQGADAIELDVQLSRDGVPVVYHDRTLSRAGRRLRRVASLDLAALAALDAGRGERIPTLEQVLERYGRRTRLLVEVKARDTRERALVLARAVAEQVLRSKLARSVFVLSFEIELLRAVAAAAPTVQRVLNLEPPRRLGARLAALLPLLSAVSADVRTLCPAFGAAIARAGLPLFAYTCNSADRVERALAAGARGVMSDRPAWLHEQLRRPR